MPQGRRINRIQTPSIDVKLRLGPTVDTIQLWREDHFEHSTYSTLDGPQTQRWLVLDFGAEERLTPVTEPNPRFGEPGAPTVRPQLDDAGEPIVEWKPTGAIQVELQRVNEDGEGMSVPSTKVIMPVEDSPSETRIQTREIDTGWLGWVHVPDSPRRPEPYAPAEAARSFAALPGGTMDIAGNSEVAMEIAQSMIAEYRQHDKHVGLSVNFGDRRCYVCDEVWPCSKATDFEAVADVDSDTEGVGTEAAPGG